jgi:membrane-associated phospholipid phosphatase
MTIKAGTLEHGSLSLPYEGSSALSRLIVRAAYLGFSPTRRNILHWTSWALSLSTVLILTVLLQDGRVFEWEETVTRTIQDTPYPKPLTEAAATLTNSLSIEFGLFAIALAGWLLLRNHPGAATLILLTFPLHVLGLFSKALVDRERPSPDFEGIEGAGGASSFPSGHAEFSITFYGFIAYLLMLRFRSEWQRALILVSWLTLVVATGFTRIEEGRHWPVDVLTGYLIGLGLLSGMIWLHSSLRHARDSLSQRRDIAGG